MDKEPAYDYEEDREKEENDKKWGQKTVRRRNRTNYTANLSCFRPLYHAILFLKDDLEE
jgi:hypothetical protein